MNTDPDSAGSILASPEPAAPPESSKLRNIFIGPNGIRAGWQFTIFLALLAVLQQLILQRGLRLIPGFVEIARQAQSGGPLTPQFQLILEGAVILVVFVATGVMSLIEKRSFGTYGIPLAGAFGKLLWQGVVWGLAFESSVILAIFAFGGFSFGTLTPAGNALVKFALLWAIGFLFVGISEEFLFRGYAQFTLASEIGFWAAAFLLSAAFGLGHLGNPGEGWVGALSVFTFGMFGCFVLRRTGNLWFIIGFHAATDYAETFIYSVPDSGLVATGHLLNSSIHGPRWLTGGTIGPEASAMTFVTFAILFLAFNWAYPAKKRAVE